MDKYIVMAKVFILISLIFIFNYFVDMLNSAGWILFIIGIVGATLTVTVFFGIVLYKRGEKKDEKINQ